MNEPIDSVQYNFDGVETQNGMHREIESNYVTAMHQLGSDVACKYEQNYKGKTIYVIQFVSLSLQLFRLFSLCSRSRSPYSLLRSAHVKQTIFLFLVYD